MKQIQHTLHGILEGRIELAEIAKRRMTEISDKTNVSIEHQPEGPRTQLGYSGDRHGSMFF